MLPPASKFRGELTYDQKNALERIHRGAAARYVFYRRHGHSRAESLRFARIWGRNMTEQRERRLSHGTGAVNWIGMWPR